MVICYSNRKAVQTPYPSLWHPSIFHGLGLWCRLNGYVPSSMLHTASLVLQHLRGPMSVPTDEYCWPLEGRNCVGHASAGLVQCLKHSRCSIGICQIKKKKEGHWCLERLHNFLRIVGSDLSIQMKVIHFPSQGVNPQIIVLEYKSQRTYIYSIPPVTGSFYAFFSFGS